MKYYSIVKILQEVNDLSSLDGTNVVQEIKNAFISAIEDEEKINKTEREAIETAYQGWAKSGCKIDHLFEFDQDKDSSHANHKEALLHIAAMYGLTKVIDALIGNGANIEVLTEQIGWTPLYIASLAGNVEVVDFLATKGAKVNIVNNLQVPILFSVSSEGDIKTVECLLKHGANVDILNPDNTTSLHEAAKNGHTKVVDALIKAKAKIDELDGVHKNTPLHFAAENNHIDIVCALIEKGAKVDALGGGIHQNTPLHLAAKNGHKRMVEFLLNKGANINAQNGLGETPLHLAAFEGKDEVLQFLINNGVDVSLKEARGLTPLDYKNGVAAALLKKAEKKAQQPIKYVITLGIAGSITCGLFIGAMLLNDSPEAAIAFATVVSVGVVSAICGVILYMCLKPSAEKKPVIVVTHEDKKGNPDTNMDNIDPKGKGTAQEKEGVVNDSSAAAQPTM